MDFERKRWISLTAGIILNLLGGVAYAWSVFVLPLNEKYGWSMSSLAIAYTMFSVTMLIANMTVIPYMRSRLPLKKILIIGGVLYGGGVAACGYVSDLWLFYLLYSVIAGAGNAMIYPTLIAYSQESFPEKPGFASGLMAAGLDSLPGAGAEILDPDVRRAISPAKPSVASWLAVMHEDHTLGLATSATMMYGHVEQPRQRVDHLLAIRDLQARCPEGKPGFLAFIPWIFRSTGTRLEAEGTSTDFSPLEYIRIIAASRLILNNIPNIQASWLTVGRQTAQAALHSGANDMGSIMIEEHVVSSAGADNRFDAEGIQLSLIHI